VEQTDNGAHVSFDGDGLSAADADRISLTTIAEMVKLTKDDHQAFVRQVAGAVAAREAMAADSLATHHHCRLGRWYYSVSDPATLALPSFTSMSTPHHGVHQAGRTALAALGTGNVAAAEAAAAAEMQRHSQEVLHCLDDFGRDFVGTVHADAGKAMAA
jgi:hypothetical protein